MIGGHDLRHVRVEPPLPQCTSTTTTAVTQFTILSSSSGVACTEWPPRLGYFNIYSILLFCPPPDGPSSGTESNLPVSHTTPGIQIVDYDTGHTPYCRFIMTLGTQMVDYHSPQSVCPA